MSRRTEKRRLRLYSDGWRWLCALDAEYAIAVPAVRADHESA
jgi:hypothetical protein